MICDWIARFLHRRFKRRSHHSDLLFAHRLYYRDDRKILMNVLVHTILLYKIIVLCNDDKIELHIVMFKCSP